MDLFQLNVNNNKELNSFLLENIHKLATPSEYENYYSIKNDIKQELKNNSVLQINKVDDSFKFIINYFENLNNDILNQKYIMLPYDIQDNLYHIMIIDIRYNNNEYINSIPIEELNKKLNSIASILVKYYNNSNAIFGDVFIISMDKDYYNNENNIKKNLYHIIIIQIHL